MHGDQDTEVRPVDPLDIDGGPERHHPSKETAHDPDPDGAAHQPRHVGPLRRFVRRLRANPTGRVALKLAVGAVGGLTVVIGLIMVPLPGPGWIIVIAGLAILAIEFAWAKHLLRLTRQHVHNWTRWIAARSLPVRLAFGAAGLIGLAFGVYMGVRFGAGIDLLGPFWEYVTTH